MNLEIRPPQALPLGIDRSQLLAVIEPITLAHGAEIVDVEFKSETGADGPGWVLRVSVEKLGSADASATVKDAAVDLSLCSNVARDLSPALDVADLIPSHYTLEVSSPGVERVLKTARDFTRFSGQKAKLRLADSLHGQKVLRGIIQFRANELTLEQDGRLYEVPLDLIDSANLVFEFGPSAKPGSQKTHPKKQKTQAPDALAARRK